MRLIEKLPVPVITIPPVLEESEGSALLFFILAERNAQDLNCLIEHEKVHIVQEWIFALAFGLLAHWIGVSFWWGFAGGFAVYLAGWFLSPWFQQRMEWQADAIQSRCIANRVLSPKEQLASHMETRIENAVDDEGNASPVILGLGDVRTWHALLFGGDDE